MCGRYTNSRSDTEIAREFGTQETVGEQPAPSWNIAPTQQRRVVLERIEPRGGTDDNGDDSGDTGDDRGARPEARVRQLRSARWGLVPSWAKDLKIGNRLINARSETITEKPSFRAAAAKRRCLVPAEGYYEWEARDGRKVPHFLHHEDQLLAFAGLYELWPDPDKAADDPDRWLWSSTVLTRPAPDALGHIHDRSPIVVPADLRADWLNPAITGAQEVNDLLAAIPDPGLTPHEVSAKVNNVRNNGPELIAAAFA